MGNSSVGIAGMAWVTPLGLDLDDVWKRLCAGYVAETQQMTNPETGRIHKYRPVPPKLVEHLGRQPRLRRASPISYFTVGAGLAAIENARLTLSPEFASRMAVVCAVSDGSVVYTRKFYDQIVRQGANAASPMLFPETVYNAPASHLAAALGIDGASYTLVGDQSVGLAALKLGIRLINLGDADQVIVVGAEELDWILGEAYRDWRLARTPLSEGGAAILLSRDARLGIDVHSGVTFFRRSEAGSALDRAARELAIEEPVDLIVSSANRTFIDAAEAEVCSRLFPSTRTIAPKASLGEAMGASALWQIVAASHAIERGEAKNAFVPVIGFNQQASAAHLFRRSQSGA